MSSVKAILDFEAVDNALQAICAILQLCLLLGSKRKQNLIGGALITNDGQKRKCYVVNSVFTVKHSGNGQGSIKAVQETLAKVANRHGNSIEGSALSADNTTAGGAYIQRILRSSTEYPIFP